MTPSDLKLKLDQIAIDTVASIKHKPEVGVGLFATTTTDTVSIGEYTIIRVPDDIRHTYIIMENGKEVYSHLMLFESAMGIVKHLAFTQKISCARVIDQLDMEYAVVFYEMSHHKIRASSISDGPKRDIILAKHSQCHDRLGIIKNKIANVS